MLYLIDIFQPQVLQDDDRRHQQKPHLDLEPQYPEVHLGTRGLSIYILDVYRVEQIYLK